MSASPSKRYMYLFNVRVVKCLSAEYFIHFELSGISENLC